MKLWGLVLTVFLAICASLRAEPVMAQTPLVGSWELLKYADTPEGGEPIHAFGDPPAGLFVFTADGRASINIMRNPPDVEEASVDVDPDACIPAWYCSYFGTYSYDAAGSNWTTHVTGGNIPSYLGTDQRRHFTLSGDILTITETYVVDGRAFQAERVLKRVSP